MRLTLLCLFAFQVVYGQKITFYEFKNYAKWPMTNTVLFFAKDIACDSIFFKCDNGKILQEGCKIIYWPDSSRDARFTAFRKHKKELIPIDTIDIAVVPNENAEARLGSKTYGRLTKNSIIVMGGINAKMYATEGHSENIMIESYRFTTIANDILQSCINLGNRYNEKTLSLINNLHTKDRILISEIKARDFKGRYVHITPLEYTVE